MKFKNLKIGRRFGMGYGYMIVLTTIIGIIYINEMEVLTKRNLQFYEQSYNQKMKVDLLREYIHDMQLIKNKLVFSMTDTNIDSLIFILKEKQKSFIETSESLTLPPELEGGYKSVDSLFQNLRIEDAKLTGNIKRGRHNQARSMFHASGLVYYLSLQAKLQDLSHDVDILAADFYQGIKDRRIQMWIIMGLLFVFAFITNIWLAFAIVKTVTKPLQDFVGRVKEITRGNLEVEIEGDGKDEISILAQSFREMQENLQYKSRIANQIAQGNFNEKVTLISDRDKVGMSINQIVDNFSVVVDRANKIASGDFSSDVKPRSGNDELGMAMLNMLNSLKEVVRIAKVVANGDYSVMLKPKSINDDLSIALSGMTSSLRDMSSENERQNWIKTGVNSLNEMIRGDIDVQELAKNIVTFLSKYLNIPIGAMYLANDDGSEFHLTASYAFTHRKGMNNTIKPGEGVVGQAAIEKEIISLTNVPENYIQIGSALGNEVPRNIVVVPFVFNDVLYGLIELGSFAEMTRTQLEFLEAIAENVAIALNTAKARKQMKMLLQTTQEQAKELQKQQAELKLKNEVLKEQTQALRKSEQNLQAQQEELKVSNEELEEQTSALKKSEQNLQSQQEELKVINEELEEKTKSLELQKSEISRKNADLEEARQQIEHKAKELEITSKYKSEFLANMSHELRTPLNSLLILSQDLANNVNSNLDNNEVESAEIINKSGQDLLNLINEILDLSKIESGKMEMHFEEVSINDLFEKSRRNFKRLIEEKGLLFKIEMNGDVPDMIVTDFQRLDQIIKNLLSNSLKFTHEGEIILSCSKPAGNVDLTNSGLKIHNALAISVRDSGIGIPESKQREIFEAFQQADGSTSRKFGGTGLGLSISKELAKLLHGELHLTSETGKGSEFILYIPVNLETSGKLADKEPESENAIPETDFQIENKSPDNGINTKKYQSISDDRNNIDIKKNTILIIEDDPVFARTLYKQCRQKGFNSIATATGEEGLKLAEEFDPGAIILDIKLPGIDGYTVLERLKDNSSTRHIPVHMMSGYEESMDVYKMGAIGYLTKPVDSKQLSESFGKIESYMQRDIKNLLLVEDDTNIIKSIKKLIGENDLRISEAGTGFQAFELLKSGNYDCIVLDLGLPDMTGFELLDKLEKELKNQIPPVIVYTGRDLDKDENIRLQQYTNTIILKGVKSEERLLDETALFLHRIVAEMPKNQQQIIKNLHNKEELFKNKNILIVDDDMRNVFALSKILEAKGMQITKAVNGKMALDIIQQNGSFDLVLMDIMMPVMDGYIAMNKIREITRFQSLPIIALTAKAMKNDREKCIAAGASDYLTKPVNMDKLLSLMRVWLYK